MKTLLSLVLCTAIALCARAATYTVLNTNDSGAGSLRQAIINANSNAGPDTIAFNISGAGGVKLIAPLSPLPLITGPVLIDGYTQPNAATNSVAVGDNAVLRIELCGTNVGAVVGLDIAASGCTVRGLVINQFEGGGIYVEYGVNNTSITGNFIGTDATGTNGLGNGQFGISLGGGGNNTIGGAAPSARNLISGNDSWGIRIDGGGSNRVSGNYIGTDRSGTGMLPNSGGVLITDQNPPDPGNIIGGTAAGAGNVISGNDIGVQVVMNNVTVQGNVIGLDATATLPLGNGTGIEIDGHNTLVGGTNGFAINVISGNAFQGIEILGGNANKIFGNYIGTDITGTNAMPNDSGVECLGGAGNEIGGSDASRRNIISGNLNVGVTISGTLATANVVAGNYIGLGADGTTSLGNQSVGVLIDNSPNNTIGGVSPGEGNAITENSLDGVEIQGANAIGNVIAGNRIGLGPSGMPHAGNGGNGVIVNDASGNIIGGTESGARNIISGNGESGIAITGGGASGNTIVGNYIGTTADGMEPLGNNGDGLLLQSPNNIIGGEDTGAGNIVGGNLGEGINVVSAGNIIQGNNVGIGANGGVTVPNGLNGICVAGSFNRIGGTNGTSGNTVSANGSDGILIFASGPPTASNIVQGNYIGMDVAGTPNIGNAFIGVRIYNSRGNQIGGMIPGAGNVIAGNGEMGIELEKSSLNVIAGNGIGTTLDGDVQRGNVGMGLSLLNSSGNIIGGSSFGAGNLIANNGDVGIGLEASDGQSVSNAILGNLIYANTGRAIDLNLDGLTGNDSGDADNGPNNLQNFPVLNSATTAGSTSVSGLLNSLPNRAYRIEFFGSDSPPGIHGPDAQVFLGAIDTATDGAGNAFFFAALPATQPGTFLSATATDPQNNTSELSGAVQVSHAFGIGALSAVHAAVGSTITIYGTNFSLFAEENIVYFGTVRAAVLSATSTNLVVVVPAGAAYGPITVTWVGSMAYSRTPFVPTFPSANPLQSLSFAPSFNLPPGIFHGGMAIGDLDGDGAPDLVVASQTNTVTAFIYQNIEPGGNLTSNSFAAPQLLGNFSKPTAIALADIDADGWLDLIVLKSLPNTLEVYRNLAMPGSIIFSAPSVFPALGGSLGGLAVADLDGDGLPDVIATGMTNNQVAVYRNTSTPGSIHFDGHWDFAAGMAPVSVAVADFDQDGKLDIAVADANGINGAVQVLRNLSVPGVSFSPGSFAVSASLTNGASGAIGIVAADFDGDGTPDIAVALTTSNLVKVYRKTSPQGVLNSGSFATRVDLVCGGAPAGLAVADLDGDAKLDLICANTNTSNISAFWNLAAPGNLNSNSFAPRLDLPIGFGSFAVAAADFDLDGKPDLIALGKNPDKIGLMRNQENEPFFRVNSVPAPPGGTVLVTNSATVQIFNRFTNGAIYYTLDVGSPGTELEFAL